MKFCMSYYPGEFDIPKEWLLEAGYLPNKPYGITGAALGSAAVFELTSIEPPFRSRSSPMDWHGFDKGRFVSVLHGVVGNGFMEPVELRRLAEDSAGKRPYEFRVVDGYHRFHAALVAGWSQLPGVLKA